jgi:RNA polymerase sigma-70 factor (ECF subfamily)
MNTTSLSLLKRLREPLQADAWPRFVDLYTPLLYDYARRLGLQETDAADLVQEVFVSLLQKLPDFAYDPQGSFRSWLRTVTVNKWRELHRRKVATPVDAQGPVLADLPSPEKVDEFWETEYRQHLVGRVLELLKPEFQPATWTAFSECVLKERPTADVARELGISTNAIYLAKSRVLRRMREELEGMLE